MDDKLRGRIVNPRTGETFEFDGDDLPEIMEIFRSHGFEINFKGRNELKNGNSKITFKAARCVTPKRVNKRANKLKEYMKGIIKNVE